jgi:hypothetical protein
MMSKKDYCAAAEIIGRAEVDTRTKQAIAAAFVSLFIRDNPRFDEERFLSAAFDGGQK